MISNYRYIAIRMMYKIKGILIRYIKIKMTKGNNEDDNSEGTSKGKDVQKYEYIQNA